MRQLLFLFLLGIAITIQAQPNKSTSSRLDSLQSDLTLLRTSLQQEYPSLYRYTSKSTMDALFDSCHAALQNNTSALQFFGTVKFLLSALKDGHLYAGPSQALRQQLKEQATFLPFRVRFINDTAYIQHTAGNSLPPGTVIIAINNRSIDSIQKVLFQYITADGDIESKKRYILGNVFYFYYYLVFGPQKYFDITYRAADGSINTKRIEAVPEKEIPAPMADLKMEPLLHLSVTPDSIAVLTIRSFDKTELTEAKLDFEAFLQSTFTRLKEQRIKKLVIDLRNNGGGRDLYGSLLYAYIAREKFHYLKSLTAATDKLPFDKFRRASTSFNDLTPAMLRKTGPQRYALAKEAHTNLTVLQPAVNNYTNDVWFLINGLSYSTTAEFCAIARSQQRGVFVGEETGGAYEGNTSGQQLTLVLPNTQTTISFGLIQYDMAVRKTAQKASGVLPDHAIQPTMNDLLNGKDPQLEYALELARRRK